MERKKYYIKNNRKNYSKTQNGHEHISEVQDFILGDF